MEELASKYRERFLTLARFQGIQPQDCPDVVQDALCAAFDQIKRGVFRGESSLLTWLTKIVHGKVVDYQRSAHEKKRRATSPLSPEALAEIDASAVARKDDPELRLCVHQ